MRPLKPAVITLYHPTSGGCGWPKRFGKGTALITRITMTWMTENLHQHFSKHITLFSVNPGYECGNVVTGFRFNKMFEKMDNLSQYEHKAARPAVRPRGSVEFPLSVIVFTVLLITSSAANTGQKEI